MIATGNLFDLLGVRAHHGRLLAAADDVAPGGHPVAVVSHRVWQNGFGGRANIVGSKKVLVVAEVALSLLPRSTPRSAKPPPRWSTCRSRSSTRRA